MKGAHVLGGVCEAGRKQRTAEDSKSAATPWTTEQNLTDTNHRAVRHVYWSYTIDSCITTINNDLEQLEMKRSEAAVTTLSEAPMLWLMKAPGCNTGRHQHRLVTLEYKWRWFELLWLYNKRAPGRPCGKHLPNTMSRYFTPHGWKWWLGTLIKMQYCSQALQGW